MICPETFARYAAQRVPRYTSYPPAPHFSPELDAAAYKSWLRSLPPSEPISIYLHIPFCREMCWYCGCHTSVTRRQARVSRYVDSLIAEIAMVAAGLPEKLAIGHLHLGGGSPTILAPADVNRLGACITGTFSIDADAEIAVEVDPRTLHAELATALADIGVNRASIGVQTFDPRVQAAINRVQSFEVTATAVATLRGSGVAAINFDLIYGLPHQSVGSCIQTVSESLQLRPDRLSVFGYAHVPGFKPHQRRISEADLPDASNRLAQAQAIEEALLASGYEKVGLDHFALPGDSLAIAARNGTLRRNFHTVDSCETLLGFGASAIGRLPQGFVQNAARIPDYEQRIASGELATVRGYALTSDDRRRATIIEQLMCNYRAEISGIDAPLGHLERDGLLRRSGTTIELTDGARPLVRAVTAAFDAHLPNSAATHVSAV